MHTTRLSMQLLFISFPFFFLTQRIFHYISLFGQYALFLYASVRHSIKLFSPNFIRRTAKWPERTEKKLNKKIVYPINFPASNHIKIANTSEKET